MSGCVERRRTGLLTRQSGTNLEVRPTEIQNLGMFTSGAVGWFLKSMIETNGSINGGRGDDVKLGLRCR